MFTEEVKMNKDIVPRDQGQREIFASDTKRSLSVYSPAGSGKTHAIVQRILSLLKREDSSDVLTRLYVLTYTERAANEMRIRTRAAALSGKISRQRLQSLDRAFFGTIHALCASLIPEPSGSLTVARNSLRSVLDMKVVGTWPAIQAPTRTLATAPPSTSQRREIDQRTSVP